MVCVLGRTCAACSAGEICSVTIRKRRLATGDKKGNTQRNGARGLNFAMANTAVGTDDHAVPSRMTVVSRIDCPDAIDDGGALP